MNRTGGTGRRILVVLLLLVVVGVGLVWLAREQLDSAWDRLTGRETRATPELAAQAEDKLAALGTAGTDRVGLTEEELQSLVEYRWSGFLPQDVVEPRVAVSDGQVTLEGGVATARFAEVSELQEIVAFLPDTTALRAVATFSPLDDEHVALEVHELGAAGIPIPARLIPTVLSRFRGSGLAGLPPNALAIPLPAGIRSVHVEGDSLFFTANEAGGA